VRIDLQDILLNAYASPVIKKTVATMAEERQVSVLADVAMSNIAGLMS
jgi:hypothetical protein